MIDIIFVHYQDKASLKKCLRALEMQSLLPSGIRIVDNSDDLEADDVQTSLPLELIKPKKNLGFAAASNLAAKTSTAAWLAFLNADAFPEPDWLEQLMTFTELHKDASCISSKQIFFDAQHLLDGTGDAYHFSGLYWRRGYKHAITELYPKDVFSASGAALFIKRPLFLAIGEFDEAFFSYGEDVDLGFRLRLAGHPSYYCEKAIVKHVGYSSSGGRHSDFSLYYGHRNLLWVYFKNMPLPLLILCLPAHIAINLISIVKFSLQGQSKTIFKAKWHAFKNLPSVLKKRKTIQAKRKITLKQLWQSFNKTLER